MLVYRVVDEEEVSIILDEESLKNIGNTYVIDKNINSHNYKPNKKYIHFFLEYGDIFYYDSEDRRYICTYDVQEDILEKSKGIGYYLDRYFLRYIKKVPEFAIESNLISFDNLLKIEKITDIILFEEFIDGEYKDRIETIYTKKEKNKTYQKTFNKK